MYDNQRITRWALSVGRLSTHNAICEALERQQTATPYPVGPVGVETSVMFISITYEAGTYFVEGICREPGEGKYSKLIAKKKVDFDFGGKEPKQWDLTKYLDSQLIHVVSGFCRDLGVVPLGTPERTPDPKCD